MNWVLDLSRQYTPQEGQANLFGVILFSDAHPYIKKLLRDDDYWQALDEVSGPRWSVFAVRAAPGSWGFPSLPPGVIGMMRQVWKEPSANKELLSAFELDSTKELPVLVVFSEDADGTVFRTALKIPSESVANAYDALRSMFQKIATALDIVQDEFRRDGSQAFHAVSYTIRDYKEWQRLKRGAELLRILRSAKFPHVP